MSGHVSVGPNGIEVNLSNTGNQSLEPDGTLDGEGSITTRGIRDSLSTLRDGFRDPVADYLGEWGMDQLREQLQDLEAEYLSNDGFISPDEQEILDSQRQQLSDFENGKSPEEIHAAFLSDIIADAIEETLNDLVDEYAGLSDEEWGNILDEVIDEITYGGQTMPDLSDFDEALQQELTDRGFYDPETGKPTPAGSGHIDGSGMSGTEGGTGTGVDVGGKADAEGPLESNKSFSDKKGHTSKGTQIVGTGIDKASGSYRPVILDLDGDGIEVALTGAASFDLDGDGYRELTSWASPEDGFLVIDLAADGSIGAGDGVIDQARELVLSLWGPEGTTDLRALAQATDDLGNLIFDSNGDGVLDAQDQHWGEFPHPAGYRTGMRLT